MGPNSRGATRQWFEGLYAEWAKIADANKIAAVLYIWFRVVRKAQRKQCQAEAVIEAEAIKVAAANEAEVKATINATEAEAERAAEAIRVSLYGQMYSVAAMQNSRWCLVVYQLCELMGIC